MYRAFLKRLIDLLVAIPAFVILFPLFIVLTILLAIANNGKPFFTQLRPGRREKIFRVVKFKTMNDKRGADGELLPDKDRITALGRFIRGTSLDEIPQLLNVIAGQMSIVGPRPLLVEYLPRYNERQRMRHNVRPGITGWAQVNGRNAISWPVRLEYDAWYVEHISFSLDCRIVWLTLMKAFTGKDVEFPEDVVVTKFQGN